MKLSMEEPKGAFRKLDAWLMLCIAGSHMSDSPTRDHARSSGNACMKQGKCRGGVDAVSRVHMPAWG